MDLYTITATTATQRYMHLLWMLDGTLQWTMYVHYVYNHNAIPYTIVALSIPSMLAPLLVGVLYNMYIYDKVWKCIW